MNIVKLIEACKSLSDVYKTAEEERHKFSFTPVIDIGDNILKIVNALQEKDRDKRVITDPDLLKLIDACQELEKVYEQIKARTIYMQELAHRAKKGEDVKHLIDNSPRPNIHKVCLTICSLIDGIII